MIFAEDTYVRPRVPLMKAGAQSLEDALGYVGNADEAFTKTRRYFRRGLPLSAEIAAEELPLYL